MKRWFHLYQVDAEKTTFIYIYMFEKDRFIEMWADVFFEKLCLYYLKVFSEDRQVEPLDGCTTFLKEHRIH
jgi:hypothetical protein